MVWKTGLLLNIGHFWYLCYISRVYLFFLRIERINNIHIYIYSLKLIWTLSTIFHLFFKNKILYLPSMVILKFQELICISYIEKYMIYVFVFLGSFGIWQPQKSPKVTNKLRSEWRGPPSLSSFSKTSALAAPVPPLTVSSATSKFHPMAKTGHASNVPGCGTGTLLLMKNGLWIVKVSRCQGNPSYPPPKLPPQE